MKSQRSPKAQYRNKRRLQQSHCGKSTNERDDDTSGNTTAAAELEGPVTGQRPDQAFASGFSFSCSAKQCRAQRKCLEEDPGEREKNKRTTWGEDRWRQRIRQD